MADLNIVELSKETKVIVKDAFQKAISELNISGQLKSNFIIESFSLSSSACSRAELKEEEASIFTALQNVLDSLSFAEKSKCRLYVNGFACASKSDDNKVCICACCSDGEYRCCETSGCDPCA